MLFSLRKFSLPFIFAGVFILSFTGGLSHARLQQDQSDWDEQTARLETILTDNGLPEDALVNLLSDNCVSGLRPDLFETFGYSQESWELIAYQLDVELDLDMFFNQLCFVTQYEWTYMAALEVDEVPAEPVNMLIDRLLHAGAGMDDNALIEYLMADLVPDDYYYIYRNMADTLDLTDAYDEMAQQFDAWLDESGLTDAQYYELDLGNAFKEKEIMQASYGPQYLAYLTVKKRLQDAGLEDFAARNSVDAVMDNAGFGDEAMGKTPCIAQQYKEVFDEMKNTMGMTDDEFDDFMTELKNTGQFEEFLASVLPPEHYQYLDPELRAGVEQATEDEDNPFGLFEFNEDEWCSDADGDICDGNYSGDYDEYGDDYTDDYSGDDYNADDYGSDYDSSGDYSGDYDYSGGDYGSSDYSGGDYSGGDYSGGSDYTGGADYSSGDSGGTGGGDYSGGDTSGGGDY